MKKRIVLTVMVAALGLSMLMTAGAVVGVGQDAYPVADLTVSPGQTVCIGGTITISGGGAPPGSSINVSMVSSAGSMTRGTQGGYAASLGTAVADASGNWSLTTVVPSTVTVIYGGNPAEPEGSTVAVRSGSTWWIEADNFESGNNYTGLGELDLVNCAVVMPSTGIPSAAIALMGAVVLFSAGLGLRLARARR